MPEEENGTQQVDTSNVTTCDNKTRDMIQDIIKDVVGKEFADMRDEVMNKTADRKYTNGYTDIMQLKANSISSTQHRKESLLDGVRKRRAGADPAGIKAAKCVRYLFQTKGDVYRAIELAEMCGDKEVAEGFIKTVQQTNFANGGALIPTQFAAEIIEKLEATSVAITPQTSMDDLNAVRVQGYEATDSTSTWTTENAVRSSSTPTSGQLMMTEHFLSTIVPVSDHWLRNSGDDTNIRNRMLRSMREKLDLTLIRSLGVSSEPLGFRGLQANTFTANATLSAANATADGARAIRLLLDANIDVNATDTKWRFAPRTWQALLQLRDSSGTGYPFREELDKGMWLGHPFLITSQIPINLGAGSNESEIYLVHDPMMLFGIGQDMAVTVYPGGTYYNGSSLVSGIAQSETVFKVENACDFAAKQRGVEIVYISGVKWAA